MAKENKFMAPKQLSEELEAVVGKGPMPFPEVVKNLWVYIKKHDLQDPKNKRTIVPDEKLAKVFGSSAPVNMMKMSGLVFKHLS
jgi:chromatin remodeling complex protein RSC6